MILIGISENTNEDCQSLNISKKPKTGQEAYDMFTEVHSDFIPVGFLLIDGDEVEKEWKEGSWEAKDEDSDLDYDNV